MGAAGSHSSNDNDSATVEAADTFRQILPLEAFNCCKDARGPKPQRILIRRQPTAAFESPGLLKLRAKSSEKMRSISPTKSCQSGASSASSVFSDGYSGGAEPHFWA